MARNKVNVAETQPIVSCIYCEGTDVIKKGFRQKKHERIQLYYCHHCRCKFTPLLTKGKSFPMRVILDALSFYNRFYRLEEAAEKVSEKYGIAVSAQNISNWLGDFGKYLSFLRMREFIEKKYDRREILVETKLFHNQVYDFKYHRAKTDLILEEHFKHYRFRGLQEFLELVTAECPHQVFRESQKRASEFKDIFDLDKVKITPKNNTAVRNTRLILQAVANNKLRHTVVQEFMLVNDSVTIAAEVPVLLDRDDLLHYQNHLGFKVPLELKEGEVLTGHIDLIQIRNGSIHIMDFKPSAKKVKPVDQLTIYALALSRLTGIRLFYFKCAWFDKDDYFEFFPLHVVHKKTRKKKKTRKRTRKTLRNTKKNTKTH